MTETSVGTTKSFVNVLMLFGSRQMHNRTVVRTKCISWLLDACRGLRRSTCGIEELMSALLHACLFADHSLQIRRQSNGLEM